MPLKKLLYHTWRSSGNFTSSMLLLLKNVIPVVLIRVSIQTYFLTILNPHNDGK
jgi:hypothetical protein